MIKYDCFGYDHLRKTCSPMAQLKCQGCNFYKTVEKHNIDKAKAKVRLENLGHIAIGGFLSVGKNKYPIGRF